MVTGLFFFFVIFKLWIKTKLTILTRTRLAVLSIVALCGRSEPSAVRSQSPVPLKHLWEVGPSRPLHLATGAAEATWFPPDRRHHLIAGMRGCCLSDRCEVRTRVSQQAAHRVRFDVLPLSVPRNFGGFLRGHCHAAGRGRAHGQQNATNVPSTLAGCRSSPAAGVPGVGNSWSAPCRWHLPLRR